MAEEKISANLKRIEDLIVGGNKEVIDRVEKKIEDTKQELRQEFRKEIGIVKEKMQEVYSGLKNEIKVTAYAVKDEIKDDIKRVEGKLDEHMRQPAHA